MKQIDLFFEVLLAVMFGAMAVVSMLLAFAAWWHMLIAAMDVVMVWVLTREIKKKE